MPKPNVREQLVRASFDTLYSKGFNATSVQDIAEAAGVPKGSFYNHFASKEVLGAEIIALYAERGRASRTVLDDTSLTPLTRLQRYLGALVEYGCADEGKHGCMLGNFSAELSTQSPAIRAGVEAGLAEWSAHLASVIGAAQQLGEVAGDHPATDLAAFIVDAWEGAVLRSRARQQPDSLRLFLTMVMTRILR
jgi:TetR/AcrR family transcriptional repressor of nem operon